MEEIRRLRRERGLSQAKLAALADLDPSTVSQIETGARRANTRTLERLAEALGAEVADLFPKEQPSLPLDLEQLRESAQRLMDAGVSEATARGVSGVDSRSEEYWRALAKASGLESGLEGGLNLNASYWIECLNAQAELCEHMIERGDYDLETMWNLEGAAVELWGTYSRTVKRLVREWCTPNQAEALRLAETRMKEARSAARRAYLERRDGEADPRIVDELEAKRQAREARYAKEGNAAAGA